MDFSYKQVGNVPIAVDPTVKILGMWYPWYPFDLVFFQLTGIY